MREDYQKTLWKWGDPILGLLRLWYKGFAGFFPVLFLEQLVVGGILWPLIDASLKLALKLSGYSYLTLQNIRGFLEKPAAWLFCLLWLSVFSLVFLLEQMVATYYFHLKEQGMGFRMVDMLHSMLYALRHPLKRRLGRLLPVALLQRLLSCAVVFGYMLIKLRIPNNLWTDLRKMLPELLLVLAVGLFLFLCGFFKLFYSQYFMIEGLSGGESAKRGRRLLRRNRLRTFLFYLLLMGIVAVCSFLFYLLLMIVVAVVLKVVMKDRYILAKFLAMYDSLNLLVAFLIGVFSTYLFQGMVTHLFYQYKDERDELTAAELAYGYIEKTQMKRYIILVRILAVLVLLVAVFSVWNIARNGTFQAGELLPVTQITAHRGQSVEAPENTLPALEQAIAQAADYAEIDVRQTADGVVVLMHDLSLKRICGVSKNVNQMTYEELQQLDAGAWFSKEYQGTRIPTLEEAMELCKGSMNLNIEIKTAGDTDTLTKKVAELIERYDFEKQCVISSTDYKALLAMKEWNENVRTGFIMSMAYGNYYDKDGIDFFSIKSGFVTQSTVDRLHQSGQEIHVWTVNTRAELQRVRNLGVDNVITDDVLLARQVCFHDMEGAFRGILRAILKVDN